MWSIEVSAMPKSLSVSSGRGSCPCSNKRNALGAQAYLFKLLQNNTAGRACGTYVFAISARTSCMLKSERTRTGSDWPQELLILRSNSALASFEAAAPPAAAMAGRLVDMCSSSRGGDVGSLKLQRFDPCVLEAAWQGVGRGRGWGGELRNAHCLAAAAAAAAAAGGGFSRLLSWGQTGRLLKFSILIDLR